MPLNKCDCENIWMQIEMQISRGKSLISFSMLLLSDLCCWWIFKSNKQECYVYAPNERSEFTETQKPTEETYSITKTI